MNFRKRKKQPLWRIFDESKSSQVKRFKPQMSASPIVVVFFYLEISVNVNIRPFAKPRTLVGDENLLITVIVKVSVVPNVH